MLPKIGNLSQNTSGVFDPNAQDQMIDQTEKDLLHVDMIHQSNIIDKILQEPVAGETKLAVDNFLVDQVTPLQKIRLRENHKPMTEMFDKNLRYKARVLA